MGHSVPCVKLDTCQSGHGLFAGKNSYSIAGCPDHVRDDLGVTANTAMQVGGLDMSAFSCLGLLPLWQGLRGHDGFLRDPMGCGDAEAVAV